MHGTEGYIFQSTQPSQAVTITGILASKRRNISIHTALAGCDVESHDMVFPYGQFQSTQPSQAVTQIRKFPSQLIPISIHTALAGCDEKAITIAANMLNFNPHSPRRL